MHDALQDKRKGENEEFLFFSLFFLKKVAGGVNYLPTGRENIEWNILWVPLVMDDRGTLYIRGMRTRNLDRNYRTWNNRRRKKGGVSSIQHTGIPRARSRKRCLKFRREHWIGNVSRRICYSLQQFSANYCVVEASSLNEAFILPYVVVFVAVRLLPYTRTNVHVLCLAYASFTTGWCKGETIRDFAVLHK